mgnify:CR=1 FL=1
MDLSQELYLFLAGCILIGGIWNVYRNKKAAQTVDQDLFFKSVIANPNGVLIDVRTPAEYQSGFILNAVNIDFLDSGFIDEISALDREKTYYIYCQSGKRSSGAIRQMNQLGFKHLIELSGGVSQWKKPLETPRV